MKTYIWLYQVSLWLRNTKIGKKIYDLLELLGIRCGISRFFNRLTVQREYKNPTQRMIESQRYFQNEAEKIEQVIALLEDDESKECLEKMIKFRCESAYNKLPKNKMKTQYFFNNFFEYEDGEVLVDCGAYDGDSIANFKRAMKTAGKCIGKIIALEPDEKNCKNLESNHPDVQVIRGGAWKTTQKQTFSADNNVSKAIEAEKTIGNTVQVYALDEVKECNDVTLLKMDIEGAEQAALQGAKEIIKRNRPKLAICIYHCDSDMLEIPQMIHNLVPEYKLYVRQHSNCICETVVYATL